MSGLDIL